MPESPLLVQLALALVAAAIGGTVAAWARSPLLVGYIAGGILLGPAGLGLIRSEASIQALADLGVVLLLFAVGVEFRLDELRSLGPLALKCGVLQVLASVLVVTGLVVAAGAGWQLGVFWGCLVALSSTAVSMRSLAERGDLDSAHGRLVAGFLIVQDVAVVPMALILPWLASSQAHRAQVLVAHPFSVRGFLAVLGILALLLFATRLLPRMLRNVSAEADRELYLLAVFGVGLLVALGTAMIGLSLGLGAFFAGLALSQSPYAQLALGGIRPLRDLFASLFFVSLGLLMHPQVLIRQPTMVLGALALVVLLKVATTALPLRGYGRPWRLVAYCAAALVPLGEFNLVLGTAGRRLGLMPGVAYDVLVILTLLTAAITPALLLAVETVVAQRRDAPLGADSPDVGPDVLVLGLGRIGQTVAQNLRRWGLSVVAVDVDHGSVGQYQAQGGAAIWGDATDPQVLLAAGLAQANLLLTTLPDATSNVIAVRVARRTRPNLRIIARAHRAAHTTRLYDAGANVVVEPEFEGAITLLRAALEPLGQAHHPLGEEFARIRVRHASKERLAMGKAGMIVADFPIGPAHPWIGWTVAQVQAKVDQRLTAIIRQGEVLHDPDPQLAIAAGDELLLMSRPQELASIGRLLESGEDARL